ncbi:MAG: enoyl-CoA hydratase-related protein [Acidimicrobiales bacterium]
MSDFTEIRYEELGRVGVITIDRPHARNALTFTTYDEIQRAVEQTEAWCLVITGTDPAFCSGDDVKQVMTKVADRPVPADSSPRITPLAGALLKTDVPIIAAVNGAAVGWGMELALFADIRIASAKARFGELFVKRGLCCDVAGIGLLADIVGREAAAELLFTGRLIDASMASEVGLVSKVVPHVDLMATALHLAAEIAANPPLAVQRIKAGLRKANGIDWEELGAWVTASLCELFQTEDHKEGVTSFLEKRPATFVGR